MTGQRITGADNLLDIEHWNRNRTYSQVILRLARKDGNIYIYIFTFIPWNPTDPFTVLKPPNTLIDVSELH